MSIWDGVDRTAFESNLSALLKRGKYQDVSRLSGRFVLREAEDDPPVLDANTESQLADDFAFLASTTTWPRDVTAAAVQQKSDPDRLCVSIAANQGIPVSVQNAFQKILENLERRASRKLGKEETQELCQNAVVPVHRNRIFGRLGSPKTRGQKVSQVNVHERLSSLLKEVHVRTRRHGVGNTAAQLHGQLKRLMSSIEAAELAPNESEEECTALKELLRAAFDMAAGNDSLVQRIQCLGIRTVSARSREVRELQAFGNYWRICKYFAKVSRQHQKLFRSIELQVIEADTPKRWKGLEQFVHAEIQLLVHYEMNPTNRPRFIGASKKPCFLCYSFIRAHATYSVCQSHGEVFVQWTVPDEDYFNTRTRTELTSALKCTAGNIEQALEKSKKAGPRHLYLHPLQTVSKLLLNMSRSASTSTVGTRVSLLPDNSRVAINASPLSFEEVLPALQSGSLESIHNTGTDETALPRTITPKRLSNSRGLSLTASHKSPNYECRISSHGAEVLRVDGIEVFFELECYPEGTVDLDIGENKIQTALCRIQSMSECISDQIRIVDVEDLCDGDIIMERSSESACLRFNLQASSEGHIVELYWL